MPKEKYNREITVIHWPHGGDEMVEIIDGELITADTGHRPSVYANGEHEKQQDKAASYEKVVKWFIGLGLD